MTNPAPRQRLSSRIATQIAEHVQDRTARTGPGTLQPFCAVLLLPGHRIVVS